MVVTAMQTRTPEQVECLRAALCKEAEAADFERFVAALGGHHRCFERFLIARNDNIEKAAAMLLATLAFRRELSLDADPRPACDPAILERVQPLWPGSYAGFTPDNSPILYFAYGPLDVRGFYEVAPEADLRAFYVAFMERSLSLQNETNTGDGTPWRGMVEVHNLRGVGFSHIYVPGLRMLARVLKIGQDHYPENMRKTFFINAPMVFSAALAIVSTVLDERTLAKITITSGDGGDDLRDYVGGAERLSEILASLQSPVILQ